VSIPNLILSQWTQIVICKHLMILTVLVGIFYRIKFQFILINWDRDAFKDMTNLIECFSLFIRFENFICLYYLIET